jgi:chemotaxis signal transduction protein
MTTAAAVAQEPSELSCVLIPLEVGQLLLPSVCVAEIMPWRRIKVVADAPDWCLGLLGWRGEAVPVIRFELLNHPRPDGRRPGRCLVVMNRTGASAMPFYALAAEGLPRLVQLSETDLNDQDDAAGNAEERIVRVGAETASIPSLGYLEEQVAGLQPARVHGP